MLTIYPSPCSFKTILTVLMFSSSLKYDSFCWMFSASSTSSDCSRRNQRWLEESWNRATLNVVLNGPLQRKNGLALNLVLHSDSEDYLACLCFLALCPFSLTRAVTVPITAISLNSGRNLGGGGEIGRKCEHVQVRKLPFLHTAFPHCRACCGFPLLGGGSNRSQKVQIQ